MGFNKSYDKLFSIWFNHADYPNSGLAGGILTDMMKLELDDLTKNLFQEYDIQYRFKNDMILLLIRVNADTEFPFHPLPRKLSMRFLITLNTELFMKTNLSDDFSIDKPYRIKINLRSSVETATLTSTLLQQGEDRESVQLQQVEDRQLVQIFHPGTPGFWESKATYLKRYFAVIDIVTEGSSTHRLFQGNDQSLFYSSNSENYDKHLYKIQLKE